jgi:hypothetical protein
MGSTTPFNTRTSRTTSEKEMKSFITSSKHSGFSTAEKGSKSTSGSGQSSLNLGIVGGKIEGSAATQSESEVNESYANDSEHKEEEKTKVTQATVAQYTYMPMKTFRLREGGLVLSQYAFYRLRKYYLSLSIHFRFCQTL